MHQYLSNFENVKQIADALYTARKKNSRECIVIKELNKFRYKREEILNEVDIMNMVQNENSVNLYDFKEEENNCYIIMERCNFSLLEYLNNRNSAFSIKEIRTILDQLNNTFQIMFEKGIIHRDLNLSNILLTINHNINKITFKLSDYGGSTLISLLEENEVLNTDYSENKSFDDTKSFRSYTEGNQEKKSTDFVKETVKHSNEKYLSPEVLEKSIYSYKSDIWSLGVIIYYMFFKEYPFNGMGSIDMIKNIKEKIKSLKSTNNPLLDDLIKRMLKIEVNDRINWDSYFNHPFFQEDMSIPHFNFNCENHPLKPFRYYCLNCQKNLCEVCLKEEKEKKHSCIDISEIGLSSKEEKEIEHLIKKINDNIEKLNQLKSTIEYYLTYIKKVKDNTDIYEKDQNNNFKKHFIDCLEYVDNITNITPIQQDLEKYKNIYSASFFDSNYSLTTKILKTTFVLSIATFPSSNIIATYYDKSIEIYDNLFNTKQRIPNAHEDIIRYVSIKDENNFATCSNDRSIITWKKSNSEYIKNQYIKNAHSNSIRKVKFRSNGDLISCSWDNSVKIWKEENNKYKNIKILNHDTDINSVFSADDLNVLFTAGYDGTKIWSFEDYREIAYIKDTYCHGKNTLNRLNDDKFIVGGKGNGNISIISYKDKKVVHNIDNIFQCFCICVVKAKDVFLVGGKSENIKIYKISTYQCIDTIEQIHNNYIRGIINLTDGSIASFSDDKTIKVYKLILK